MKKLNETENLTQLLNLSLVIRSRIIGECRITKATFLNWTNGKTPIPFWAKEKINKITKDMVDREVFKN
jgi:hypothetical protein